MSKILKLAFAMGGGVSLGAFSGSALTESIKLALLRIVEGNAEYDKVEIDVFSGASAGTLSLAVMLRGLCWRTQKEEDDAKKQLFKLHTGLELKWPTIDPELQKDLIAAQTAQDLQHKAWVEMIKIDELLGGKDKRRIEALHSAPGLLDSDAVYNIASVLLLPTNGDKIRIKKRLLAENCLFACTLTNLTPLIEDSTATLATTAGSIPGLRDALRSQIHKDMRVFDIWFKELDSSVVKTSIQHEQAIKAEVKNIKNLMAESPSGLPLEQTQKVCELEKFRFPERWFRVHLPNQGNEVVDPDENNYPLQGWPLQNNRTWATIAASAIASGAFPAAFTPAVLKRYREEFGELWPKALKNVGQHPFAYIDGGVFNNYPVREAFRLASFLDARPDEKSCSTYCRRLLFVEPSVTPEAVALNVSLLEEQEISSSSLWNLGSPNASNKRTTFLRLSALIGDIIGVARHQGSAREADGIAVTRDYFAWRNEFRKVARNLTLNLHPNNDKKCFEKLVNELYKDLKEATTYLVKVLLSEMIPPGEGTVAGELKRVICEEKMNLPLHDADAYLCSIDSEGIEGHLEDWLYVHLCVYFDMLLGLEGKMENTRITAITPYTTVDPKLIYSELDPKKADAQLKELKLLGDPFAAFAGFLSERAREHDYQAGRHCAALFLSYPKLAEEKDAIRMVPSQSTGWLARPPERGEQVKKEYQKQMEENIDLLRKRVEQVVTDWQPLSTVLLPIFHLKRTLQEAVPGVVDERFADLNSPPPPLNKGVEIIILLPDTPELALDAPGLLDRDGKSEQMYIFGKNRNVISTWAVYDSRDHPKIWSGGAVREGKYLIIDQPGFHIGHWVKAPLPNGDLFKISNTCLRPVLVLHLENKKTPVVVTKEDWKIEEAAVQLSERLLATHRNSLIK